MVSKFTDAVKAGWPAGAAPKKAAAADAGGKKGKGKKGGEQAKPAQAAAAEEDDLDDLFGDDGGDAGAAAAAMKKKAAPIAKSLIVWDVKPWGEETDLEALANKILAIEMEGLQWKTQWKKEPVAYGVFKI